AHRAVVASAVPVGVAVRADAERRLSARAIAGDERPDRILVHLEPEFLERAGEVVEGVAVDRGVGVTANRVGRKRVVGTRESLDVARDALRAPFTPVATHSADLSAAHRQLVDAAPRRSGAVVELRSVSDSWRNRKTLILSRADMMGLVSPAEYIL